MDVSERGVVLVFELLEAAPALVEVEGEGGPHTFESAASARHGIELVGLLPGTSYRYRLLVGAATALEGRFRTAPATGTSPIRFVVYGDSRSGPLPHTQVLASMADADPMFVIHAGDMVAVGEREQEWVEFFRLGRPVFTLAPLFPVLGNHELLHGGKGFPLYARHLRSAGDAKKRYYAFRYGNVAFLILDTNLSWTRGDAQWTWVEQQLEQARASPSVQHIFVALHHSPLSSGRHGEHRSMVESGARQMLADGGVSLIFGGHDHLYERGDLDGLKYIVTGGGGSPLYPMNRREPYQLAFEPSYHHVRVVVAGERVSIDARRVDGSTIEVCSFVHGEAWSCDGRGAVGERGGIEPAEDYLRRYGRLVVAIVIVGLLLGLWIRRRIRRRHG